MAKPTFSPPENAFNRGLSRGEAPQRPRAHRPPKAPASLVSGEFGRTWRITCPYCGAQHFHSAGYLDEDPRQYLGHRRAPCQPREKRVGYLLTTAHTLPGPEFE